MPQPPCGAPPVMTSSSSKNTTCSPTYMTAPPFKPWLPWGGGRSSLLVGLARGEAGVAGPLFCCVGPCCILVSWRSQLLSTARVAATLLSPSPGPAIPSTFALSTSPTPPLPVPRTYPPPLPPWLPPLLPKGGAWCGGAISTLRLTLTSTGAPSTAPPCAAPHVLVTPAPNPASLSSCLALLMCGGCGIPNAVPSPSPMALCSPGWIAYMFLHPSSPVHPAPPLAALRWRTTARCPSPCLGCSLLLLAAAAAACGWLSFPPLPLCSSCRSGLQCRYRLRIPAPLSPLGGWRSSAACLRSAVSCSRLLSVRLLLLRRPGLPLRLRLAGGRVGRMLPCRMWWLRMAGGVLLLMRLAHMRRPSSAAIPGCMLGSGLARLCPASSGRRSSLLRWRHCGGRAARCTLVLQQLNGRLITGPACQRNLSSPRLHRRRCWLR